MKIAPLSVGPIHLIGIGGIGMSGIAEILRTMGYIVQGSDQNNNANTERLGKLGVQIFIGHASEHVKDASVVVHSTAIQFDNPEIIQARLLNIPVMHRSEMMAEIMRFKSCVCVSGSHGKTTTTSLMGALLSDAHLDPTIINGGIINSLQTNALIGMGDWMVVEADESDGTFVKIPSTISVITNIDPEHLDYYKTFENLKQAFLYFCKNVPFYGFSIICSDSQIVQELMPHITNRRFITYGMQSPADCLAYNIQASSDGMRFSARYKEHIFENLHIQLHGEHNVLNTLPCLVIATEFGISQDCTRQMLAQFQGVKRRFTKVGVWQGVTIIDDYAHHPSEIESTLKAARNLCTGKIIAVVQVHRYTRLQALFEQFLSCFQQADHLILSPVYSAGEQPLSGIDHIALAQALRQKFSMPVDTIQNPEELAHKIYTLAKPDDYVLFMGAGSITQWAHALEQQLENLYSPS